MEVNLTLEECNLRIKGYYSKGEPGIGLQSSFEIAEVYCPEDISNLIDWASAGNGFRELEEKVLEQIENDEPDYEDRD